MNEFDIILASLGVAVDPDDGYFTFETYKQDSTGNIYVKVDEKHYIKLSTSSDNVIYLQSRTLSPNQGSAFTLEGSDYVPNAYNYNAYDAVLYSVDNTFVTSGKTVTYKKYVCNVFSAAAAEKTYLNVNGNIVKFVQGLTNSSYNLGIGEALSTEKRLFLYNTYYKQFVSNIAPTAKAVYDFSGNYSMLNFEINASLISSHSGLSLILQTLGVTNLRDNGCKIIEGINSYYLKFNTLYINLSELGLEGNPIIKDSSGSLNEIRIKMASSYIEDFRWVLAKVTSSGIPASPYKFLEPSMINEGTINSSFVPDIASSTYVDVSSDRVVIADSEVTDAKILSWTWLGLISSYVNPSSAETVQKYFHYDNGVGKVYYLFKNASSTYVVPYEFIGEEIYNLSQKIASDVVPVNADYTYSKTDLNLTGSTKLKLILSNLGFNEINAVRKFQSNYFMEAGNSVNNFYIFSRTEGLTDKYYAIYDLRGAEELVSGSGVQYIKYNGTDFNLTATESEGTNFVVSSKPLSELTDWSMIDFVISYATNSIYETVFTSKVYVYNEQYYVRYNDQFILMPHLLEGYNGADDLFVENAGVFSLKAESDAKILDLLMFDDYDYNIIEEQYSGDFHKPLYQRSKILSGAEINLKTRLQTFDTQLIHNENLERGQVKFSNTFKLNNFESWTLSDYAIYYAFTQGYYTGSETEMAVFSYVPTFTKNGEVYYGLTYLDIVLAKIIGDNYLIHPSAQKFVLYHDANFNYYLKYISGSHYLPISAEISIDFNTMEVTSSKLDNLTASGVSAKKTEFTQNTPTKYYHGTTLDGGVPYYNYFSEINFQTFANANYAPVGISYLLESDLNTGSVRTSKVLNFDYEGRPIEDGRALINYNTFYELYNDYLVSYLMVDNAYELEVKISDTELNNAEVTHGMKIRMVFDQVYPDLEFNDYYYFNLSTEKLLLSKLMSVPNSMQSAIKTGDLSATALQRVSVNLRLSDIDVNNDDHFDISSISNWRILDFIILYEFSRDKVRHNAFKGMTVEELFTSDYYYAAYYEDTDADDEKSENDKVYLYLNNNFYDISKSVVWSDDKKVFVSNNTTISSDKYDNGTGTEVDISGLVTAGNINNFNFKVLYQTLELSINPSYSGSAVYTRHKDNISYQVGNVTYFKELDMNVVDTNYRINVSLLGTYKVKELIKKTSWVEKLMTDMQVYYPDLNWGVLLATDGWLDTLGEFSSAHVNGLFVGGQNSSNTTAAGLVLSEFFMSVATKVDNGIAEYEYSSVFDKETIRALMMSLLGEENYQALVFEAEVFMDYFNSCFAPIIDDFAAEFGEDIGQSSLRLNAYKSYLATLLLSSDIGAFLYTIATRVYAEYTIGEYLAGAAGDYSGYYSYVNQLTDDEGNIVDAFSYGSFVELLLYENEYCGTTNPVFTYNFKKAFDKYKDGEGKYLNRTYEELVADEAFYKVAAREFFNNIDKDHERIYNAGYQISEQGIVVNDEGEAVSFYSGNTYIYCYMLHVYWEIRTEVSSFNIPSYLKCYRYYLDGSLTRWDIIKNENIETADQYFEHYESEKGKIALYKRLSLLSTYRLFMPGVTLDDGSDAMLLEILKLFAELVTNPTKLANNISIPIVNVLNIFKDAQLKKDVDFVFKKSLGLYFTMGFSEDSSFKVIELLKDVMDDLLPLDLSTEACWNTILEYYDALERIINELKRVRELLPGEMTEKGSSRLISGIIAGDDKYYTDAQLDFITSAFVGLSNNVNQYILAQRRIDQMQKRSITFAMAQYGANYVTTGFEFSVKNKVYMFKPTTDPLRLAEYVMGGAFLESVGEGAKYTDPEFTGIIKASKVYDNVDHTLKTQLDSWSELRRFLSKIADQTAELYFTTNLADLDVEKNNAIKIDDPIQMEGTYSGDSIQESLYYYIANGIDRKILYRLLNQPYNAAAIPNYNNDPKKFVAVAQYILEREVSEDEFEGMTFEQFKRLAMKKIIDNEQNQDETPEERSAKYMVLFNILGMQVDLRADTLELDRVLNSAQVDKEAAVYVQYKENGFTISGKLRMSDNTLETIKVLSGLENRPTREVLIRQYEGIRPGDYYDEAFGDTFIACTYKNGLYYPVLGSASRSVKNNPKYSSYVADEILRTNFISQYYDNNSNVVVMKGIITANGYPTAIRKYNNPVEILKKQLFNTTSEEYNAVTYYRTDVGANFGSGKDLIDSSRAVPRVTTKNYTQYVYGTNYTKGIGSSVTYTGKTNLKTVVSSDYSGRFVQARSEYLMGQADDLGGISVLDDFSYFYVFGGQSWALLILAFVTIIPVMINACGGAAARILDIIVLFIISPVIISTNSLYPEGKNATYKKWRENLEGVAMGAFGYIIAFASFSLLIPMVYSVNSYVSVATYNKIVSIGGIGGFFTYPMVNSLVKCLWVITVVSVLERMPKLLLPIITANRGNLNSPHPGLGAGMGQEFTAKAKNVINEVKGEFKKVASVVSGQALLGMVATAKEELTNMIPGYTELKMVANTVKGAAHKIKQDAMAAAIEKALMAYGFDAATAKAMGNAVKEADKANQKAKKEQQEQMKQYGKQFKEMI